MAGAPKLYFSLPTFKLIVYNSFVLLFFEILFYFRLIHVASYIFAPTCHAVPYIANMEQNLYYVWVYHCVKFETASTFLSQVGAQNRFQS